MKRWDAKQRLNQFESIGGRNGLTIFGWPQGGGNLTNQFRAGRVFLDPEPELHLDPHTDPPEDLNEYRIVYESWDGLRRHEVTEMTDLDFIAFLSAEPQAKREAD